MKRTVTFVHPMSWEEYYIPAFEILNSDGKLMALVPIGPGKKGPIKKNSRPYRRAWVRAKAIAKALEDLP